MSSWQINREETWHCSALRAAQASKRCFLLVVVSLDAHAGRHSQSNVFFQFAFEFWHNAQQMEEETCTGSEFAVCCALHIADGKGTNSYWRKRQVIRAILNMWNIWKYWHRQAFNPHKHMFYLTTQERREIKCFLFLPFSLSILPLSFGDSIANMKWIFNGYKIFKFDIPSHIKTLTIPPLWPVLTETEPRLPGQTCAKFSIIWHISVRCGCSYC